MEKWFNEIRCGRTSTKTIPSPGRLIHVTKYDIINMNCVLGLDKAIGKESAAIAHSGEQTISKQSNFTTDLENTDKTFDSYWPN